MDALSALLSHFMVSARVFHTGELCGVADFSHDDGTGHLHLVREGRAIVHHPGRPAVHIDTPSLLFYPRALNHRLVIPAASAADVVCATIGFRDGAHNPLASALPDYLLMPLDAAGPLAATIDLLFQEAFIDQCGRQVVLDRLCEVLVVQVLRYAVRHGLVGPGMLAGLSDPGLSKALVAMHEQPGGAWTVDRLAAQAGMSRSRFARKFHQVIGATPADYLTDWRIVVAQGLLEMHRPVKTVALEVGYGSQPAFTKAFTSRVGMSPRAWMNRLARD